MSCFIVVEHIVRCAHTRDRPAGAELGRDADLRLAVKQYIPKDNPDPQLGDVTIIGAGANGIPKEAYEPCWEDIHQALGARGKRIRSIWMADIWSQGQSGVLNEGLTGPAASWYDHGRDLLFMINQFQDNMVQPLIGIGHSVGGPHLTHMSLFHPRLLQGLVMIDPTIQAVRNNGAVAMAEASTFRRDIWPSREAAASKFKANKFYQAWDRRIFDKFVEYGFRELPTEKYPQPPPGMSLETKPVTLTTRADLEVYLYVRANYPDPRLLHADDDNLRYDIHPDDIVEGDVFERPEAPWLFRRLPELLPSVLYIFGSRSPFSTAEARRLKMQSTGTGIGGNGGTSRGRVAESVLDAGHLVAFEASRACAAACVDFLDRELDRWRNEDERKAQVWTGLSRKDKVEINDLWRQQIRDRIKETRLAKDSNKTKL